MPDLFADRYEIDRELGRGGFGTVYLARDNRLRGRSVALKVMPPALSTDPAVVRLFQEEAGILASLAHDHIVPVYDAGVWEGRRYIVMQHLTNHSLAQVVAAEGAQPPERVRAWLQQAAAALAYAHAQGVLYRDVKSANLLLDRTGARLYVTDFGLAQAVQAGGGSSTTQTGALTGTAAYRAPEVAKTGHTAASDLYGLGVVAYELLAGRLPFLADDPLSMLMRHATEPVPPLPAGVPQDLTGLVQRLLAKDPVARPAGAAALLALLAEPAVHPEPAIGPSAPAHPSTEQAAGPEAAPAAQRLPAPQPRSRWLPIAAGLIVLAALIGIIWAGVRGFKPLAVAQATATLAAVPGQPSAVAVQTAAPRPTLSPVAGATAALTLAAAPSATPRLKSTATQPPSVTPSSTPPPSATPTAPPNFTVANASVNVRSGPGTIYPAIGVLKAGQSFTITGRNTAGDWWQFDYNGQAGWVSNSVVRADGDALAAAVVPAPPTPAASPTPVLRLGSTWTSPVDGMVQVYVPAGEFTMGSADNDSGAGNDEKPQHRVTLDAYWIDRTEVTNAMFARFVAASGYRTDAEKAGQGHVYREVGSSWEETAGADWQHPRGPDSSLAGLDQHPVVQVSWNDAAAYCAWSGRRLPTEAEWEKAARGTDGRLFPWRDQDGIGDLLNFADRNLDVSWADKNVEDGHRFTAPVGSFLKGAGPYGALDLAGNVWEWVADWYDQNYYASSPALNPLGPNLGQYRVWRGGSWGNSQWYARAACRRWYEPDRRSDDVGFRCARSG